MPYKNKEKQRDHSRNHQKKLREAKLFVDHIQNHLDTEPFPVKIGHEVCCKICDKSMSQIVEEEKKKSGK